MKAKHLKIIFENIAAHSIDSVLFMTFCHVIWSAVPLMFYLLLKEFMIFSSLRYE